jgi:hypothetical protein
MGRVKDVITEVMNELDCEMHEIPQGYVETYLEKVYGKGRVNNSRDQDGHEAECVQEQEKVHKKRKAQSSQTELEF